MPKHTVQPLYRDDCQFFEYCSTLGLSCSKDCCDFEKREKPETFLDPEYVRPRLIKTIGALKKWKRFQKRNRKVEEEREAERARSFLDRLNKIEIE